MGKPFTLTRILLVHLITIVITSVILNTLWLTQYLGKGFLVLLPVRVLNSIINIPAQAFIVYTILKYQDRFLKNH